MSGHPINLASRPFVNTRPMVRVAGLLWVLGGILTVFNAGLYWRSLSGGEEKRTRLEQLQTRTRGEEEEIATLEERLRGMGLRQQNRQAEFLNKRIAERSFAWSRLFDRLAEVLPAEVRLYSLRPQTLEKRSSGRRSEGQRVYLQTSGASSSDQALLALLDEMFADEAFEDPNLTRESRQSDGSISFQLGVVYLPEIAAPGSQGGDETKPTEVASGGRSGNGKGEGAGVPPTAEGVPSTLFAEPAASAARRPR